MGSVDLNALTQFSGFQSEALLENFASSSSGQIDDGGSLSLDHGLVSNVDNRTFSRLPSFQSPETPARHSSRARLLPQLRDPLSRKELVSGKQHRAFLRPDTAGSRPVKNQHLRTDSGYYGSQDAVSSSNISAAPHELMRAPLDLDGIGQDFDDSEADLTSMQESVDPDNTSGVAGSAAFETQLCSECGAEITTPSMLRYVLSLSYMPPS